MSAASNLNRLIAIMAALRTPGSGCPWDLQQTHKSLARYAVEEAYEVVDAIERDDDAALRDELGDLLLQVVFHARLAEEDGRFALSDVVEAIVDKMERRHPHVFGERPGATGSPTSASGVSESWDAIKRRERAARPGRGGLLAEVATALPGLTRAVALQKRAASVGFDWSDPRQVFGKIEEEMAELREAIEGGSPAALLEEIGDVLFSLANLARHFDLDPETAARATNAKFERRFAYIERALAKEGRRADTASLEEMERLWTEAKASGL